MSQSSRKYSTRCCVSGCRTRVDNARDVDKKLFRFVRRGNLNKSANPEFNELIERRFWQWIKVLGQNPRNAKSLWICSKHFVSGRPAASACHWERDWVPNRALKTGATSVDKRRISSTSNEPLTRSQNHGSNNNKNSSNLSNELPQEEASLCNQDGPFCRLCLRKNVNLRPVFPTLQIDENHIVSIIEQVSNIHLEFGAEYNSFVCCDCLQKLEDFHKCREIWQANDILIRAFREKERFIMPIPIERLQDPQQNTAVTETCEFSNEPIPIVAIPIEHLMEGTEALPLEENTCEPLSETRERHDPLLLNAAMPNETDDNKQLIESIPTTTAIVNDCAISSSSVKGEPLEELDTNTAEAQKELLIKNDCEKSTSSVKEKPPEEPDTDADEVQKELLIKKLMKKIRRETLSPKTRKSKKGSKRKKISSSVIDLTENG